MAQLFQWAGFNPNADLYVHALAVQADGKILVGGTFTFIGGQTRNYIARLSNNIAALQNLSVSQTTLTWTRSGAAPQLWHVTFEKTTDAPPTASSATARAWELPATSPSAGWTSQCIRMSGCAPAVM
jgi:hypothetical protein